MFNEQRLSVRSLIGWCIGGLKMQEWKMREWKYRHDSARVENAGIKMRVET